MKRKLSDRWSVGMAVMMCMFGGDVVAETSTAQEPAQTDQGRIIPSNVAGKKLIRAAGISGLFDTWPTFIAQADLPAKVEFWQQTGFDGLAFWVASYRNPEEPEMMHGRWWGIVPWQYEDFIPDIEAFQSVKDWGRLTDNFLWSSVAIWGDNTCQDWFNDEHWEVLLANARLQGRIARECGFKGIVLDTEQYDQHGRGPWYYPFNYQRYASTGYKLAAEEEPYSYAECVAKVRQRAEQYARAISGEYPDLTLFVIDGLYDRIWRSAMIQGLTTLEDEHGALYPAFADGLLVGLDERATIVAGTELTYGDSQYKNMLVVRDIVEHQSIALSQYPDLARKRITFSVGLWTDSGWDPKDRFSNTDVSVNQRDPERHMHAVHNAMAASDRYAWTFSHTSHFLTTNPTPLIREYWRANIEAHQPQNLDWEPVPAWDMTDYTESDKDAARQDAAFWRNVKSERWKVARELPEFWHFRFDTEQLVRHRPWTKANFDHSAWPLISVLKCWQSQGSKAHGTGVYRTRFDAPSGLDPQRWEIVLAFGALNYRSGWMDVSVNEKGFPMRQMIDVSEVIKPGQENVVVVRVVDNKSGPAGVMGHVKLLVREKR